MGSRLVSAIVLATLALGIFAPGAGAAERAIADLDPSLARTLDGLGAKVGVTVVDLADGTTWSRNGTRGFWSASSAKFPILLAVLETHRRAGRSLTSAERRDLAAMIRRSDNLTAERFYNALGRGAGLRASMRRLGISEFPDSRSWSGTPLTPRLMARIWTRLAEGRILTPTDRAYAMSLLTSVTIGRFGVAATAPEGATVALKNGWVATSDRGWAVNSAGLVTLRGHRWVIAVFTLGAPTFETGRGWVERVTSVANRRLAARSGAAPSASLSASPGVTSEPSVTPIPLPEPSVTPPPLPGPTVTPVPVPG